MNLINNKVGLLSNQYSCELDLLLRRMKYQTQNEIRMHEPRCISHKYYMCSAATISLLLKFIRIDGHCTAVRFNQFSSHQILIAIIVNCVLCGGGGWHHWLASQPLTNLNNYVWAKWHI